MELTVDFGKRGRPVNVVDKVQAQRKYRHRFRIEQCWLLIILSHIKSMDVVVPGV